MVITLFREGVVAATTATTLTNPLDVAKVWRREGRGEREERGERREEGGGRERAV